VGLYDTYLAVRHRLHDGDPPEHVAIVITERDLLANGAFDTLSAALGWAFEYGAERVTVSVSVLDAAVVSTLVRELRRIDALDGSSFEDRGTKCSMAAWLTAA